MSSAPEAGLFASLASPYLSARPQYSPKGMGVRDRITPGGVLKVLGSVLALTVLLIVLNEAYNWESVTSPQIWDWFIDLVAITSLLLTLVILSDLEEIQNRYLLRATIPDLQQKLEEKAKNLGALLRSEFRESTGEIGRELSKAGGILKQVCDRVEGVDSEIYTTADNLRKRIRDSDHTDEDRVREMWKTMHSINEQVKGLVEESKWKR